MKNKLLIGFLVLPIIIPILMIIYHGVNGGNEWRIKITGQDPRDLLRGQHILFRYDFDVVINDGDSLCINGESNAPTITKLSARARNDEPCKDVIKNYKSKNMKFYIPARMSKVADKIVRNNAKDITASIIVSNKRMILKNLYYKDTPLISYLKNNR